MKIRPYLLGVALCCATMFLIRCKRDAVSPQSENKHQVRLSDAEVLQKAKDYYKDIYGSSPNGRSAEAVPSGTPDWEHSTFFYKSIEPSAATASTDTLYEIYVTVTPTYINHSNGVIKYQIFLMDNFDNGMFQTLEVTPNLNYYLDYGFTTRYKNFTGNVKLLNQNGTVYKGVSLNNGFSADSTSTVSRRSEMESFARIIIEGMTLQTVYVYAPYINQPPGMITITYIPGVGSGYNSPATVGTGAYPDMWGSGIGNPNPTPVPFPGLYNVNTIKKDSVTNPCITEQLNNFLLADGKGAIQNAINRIFGGNGNIDIIYRERPSSDFEPGVYAHINRTDTHFSGNLEDAYKYGEAYIDFNVDAMKSLPKELIATVIIHESLHAILAARAYQIKDHHDIIASIYRDQISLALGEIFPNMSAQDRAALAWEGLKETYDYIGNRLRDAYSTSNDPGFRAKLQIILDYQNGTKGTPSGCN